VQRRMGRPRRASAVTLAAAAAAEAAMEPGRGGLDSLSCSDLTLPTSLPPPSSPLPELGEAVDDTPLAAAAELTAAKTSAADSCRSA
jgi:hypothetical protein